MKFLVSRSSDIYGENTAPCDGAVLLNPSREEWETPLYSIELGSLESLLDFCKQQRYPVIVSHCRNQEAGLPDVELEIYDSYRE